MKRPRLFLDGCETNLTGISFCDAPSDLDDELAGVEAIKPNPAIISCTAKLTPEETQRLIEALAVGWIETHGLRFPVLSYEIQETGDEIEVVCEAGPPSR